ncbi:MAG: hypothetical protein JNM90_08410 [Burkholderiales bacterium]|nr:hypothetical protein [Burkholderiales bacterium]
MSNAADAIRARGFRKWYEARLIEAHVHLVTAFLCLIAVLAVIEMGGLFRNVERTLFVLACVAFLGAAGAWNWRRYFRVIGMAQYLSARSDCPACGAYARFEVLYTGPREDRDGALGDDAALLPAMQVRCRKCGAEWRL